MDDEDLISRLLDGDADTIARVRTWIRAAFQAYRKRLGNELEDLEQEILLELTEALREGRFRGSSTLRTYVRTYVHHKGIDRLRALGRRTWVDIESLELPAPAPTALEQLSRSEQVAVALRVQERVPQPCRELWQMLRQGLSYREMSRRLGVAEGALRVRVLRCRQRALELREKILAESR